MTMTAMTRPGVAGGPAPMALAFLDDPDAARRATAEPAMTWLALVPPSRLLGSLGGDGLQAVWFDGEDLCWSLPAGSGRRTAVLPPSAPEPARRAAVVAAARVLLPASRVLA